MTVRLVADKRNLAAFGKTLVAVSGDLAFTAPCVGEGGPKGLPAEPADQAKSACRNVVFALEEAGFGASDIVRVRLWISSQDVAGQVVRALLEVFPDPDNRPAFSMIVADQGQRVHVTAEALAVRNGIRRSIYRVSDRTRGLPDACMKGDVFCTGNLSGADTDAAAVLLAPEQQARLAFQRLDDVLAQADLSHKNVAHMMVWYRDHAFRDVINGPFVERYPNFGDRPARHSLVRALPEGVGMQIEAIAIRGQRRFTYSVPGCWHHGIQQIPNSLPFATRVGNLMHTAATYGHIVDDGSMGGSLDEQCDVAFHHSSAVLRAAGLTLRDVAHIYVWITDEKSRSAVDRAWVTHFGSDWPGPVRHDIVSPLPTIHTGPFLIQLELTAVSENPMERTANIREGDK